MARITMQLLPERPGVTFSCDYEIKSTTSVDNFIFSSRPALKIKGVPHKGGSINITLLKLDDVVSDLYCALDNMLTSAWAFKSGGFKNKDVPIENYSTANWSERGRSRNPKKDIANYFYSPVWLAAAINGLRYSYIIDLLYDNVFSFHANELLDYIADKAGDSQFDMLRADDYSETESELGGNHRTLGAKQGEAWLPSPSKIKLSNSIMLQQLQDDLKLVLHLMDEGLCSVGDDEFIHVYKQMRCVVGVMSLVFQGETEYFGGVTRPNLLYAPLLLMLKKLKVSPRSGRNVDKLLSDLKKKDEIKLGSGSFEQVFKRFYDYLQATRSNTHFSYYHVSSLQGPHTIARTLSVRVNVSILKRILAPVGVERNDTAGFIGLTNFNSDSFVVTRVHAGRMLEYVACTLSLLDGILISPKSLPVASLINGFEKRYEFYVGESISAKNFYSTDEIKKADKEYCSDVIKLANEIILIIIALCRKTKLVIGNEAHNFTLHNLIYPENITRVRKIFGDIAAALNKESKNTPGFDEYQNMSNVHLMCVLMVLVQAFLDLHPCASAAVSSITKKDIGGKGERVLYEQLTSQSNLSDEFFRIAVDLRFGDGAPNKKNGGINLITSSQCKNYFSSSVYAKYAEVFLRARMYAITNLKLIHWGGSALAPKKFDAQIFTRSLSPTRMS